MLLTKSEIDQFAAACAILEAAPFSQAHIVDPFPTNEPRCSLFSTDEVPIPVSTICALSCLVWVIDSDNDVLLVDRNR